MATVGHRNSTDSTTCLGCITLCPPSKSRNMIFQALKLNY